MPLFQEKILAKALGAKIDSIPESHLAILRSWKEKIENGSLHKQTEVAIHAPFTQNIMVGVLGYTPFGSKESWTISREYAVAGGAVDLALGHFSDDRKNDNVLAPFELKGAKTKDLDAIMPGRHKTPVQQAWDYARDIKGAQWVLVCNYVELRLYAVSETSLVYEQFNLVELTDPQQYARFILLLHADNFLSGNTTKLLNQSLLADKEITAQLYNDYKALRELLISRLISDNPETSAPRLIAPAQKLLDRLLFVAFAEDKGLIPENSIQKAFAHADPYNPRPIYENFKGLFRAIDQGSAALSIPPYNGGLFALDNELDRLIVCDEVCFGVNELAKYDFDSEISVTVLGHIFEQSIADLELLTAQVEDGKLLEADQLHGQKNRAVSGKRKRQGVVYTPDHITAFIVEHTLGSHINDLFFQLLAAYGRLKKDGTIVWKRGTTTELKFWYAWQHLLQDIKVVDPACGSGAFLVAAFDYLHQEYQRINEKLAELTGQHSLFDLNKEILTNNLFGVDINPESIEISKLSLWLKTAERGKSLTSLDANLVAGNSLGLAEPVPGENSLGHANWLCIPHKELAEDGDVHQICTSNPDSKRIMLEIYQELIDLFDAKYFHVGLDEIRWKTHLLPEDQRCPLCRGKSKQDIFVEWVQMLHDFLAGRNVKMMMWGDMILPGHNGGPPYNLAETVDRLPKDVIICNWSSTLVPDASHWYRRQGYEEVIKANSRGTTLEDQQWVMGNMMGMWFKVPWLHEHVLSKLSSYMYSSQLLAAEYSWNFWPDNFAAGVPLDAEFFASRPLMQWRLGADPVPDAEAPHAIVFAGTPVEGLPAGEVSFGALSFDVNPATALAPGPGGQATIEVGGPVRALYLLQAARLRMSRADFIACPSCGRTHFDLQEILARVRARFGHLAGLKLAVMGCIVNGPGEMADADFGYVGAAPGKVDLYEGREPVEKGIPAAEAVDRLQVLLERRGLWREP